MPPIDQTIHDRREVLDFVLREGQLEIRCRVSFDALRRQAGVAEINRERAQRLLKWYRRKIERIALARYAAGELRDGIVVIDRDDIVVPAAQPLTHC